MRIIKCWKIASTRSICVYTDEVHVFVCMYADDIITTIQHWKSTKEKSYTSCYPLNDEYHAYGYLGNVQTETIVDIGGETRFTIANSESDEPPIASGYSITDEDKFAITLRHGAISWADYTAISYIRDEKIPTSMPFQYRLCMMAHVTPKLLAADFIKDFFDTLT